MEKLIKNKHGQWTLTKTESLEKDRKLHPDVQKLKSQGKDLMDAHADHYSQVNPHTKDTTTSENSELADHMKESFKQWKQTGKPLKYKGSTGSMFNKN